jgi:hypothetical protein
MAPLSLRLVLTQLGASSAAAGVTLKTASELAAIPKAAMLAKMELVFILFGSFEVVKVFVMNVRMFNFKNRVRSNHYLRNNLVCLIYVV